ncbi:glycosyltransferase family 2 protein [Burkholderia cepacia]|uniref:Glycosyltransferase family 2 protein n=1 Tax=Burkholderia cepacia TaxID=292 RepID=A0A8I1DLD1_BURCE|nr:glycosyltransferase family 2 protein [Burkholderia cepacia]MBA9942750.1 glycosyltransferase family 2 protein [Burkholderia cepacia]MBA9972894.1 glycosyltransferase family 2 protein [Burkholderia cepacia]MBA9991467.1 glycosyltransferase family 2 protein [Burkholderia cepacia]MBA9999128.1 glycosyltransferase family 2 protein [Burkholderia cepacia]
MPLAPNVNDSQHVTSHPQAVNHAPHPVDEILSISIVTYHPDEALLARTFSSLRAACARLRTVRGASAISVCVVDNGGLPDLAADRAAFEQAGIGYGVLSGHGNVGYGRGHNLAIEAARSRYHLILNPDIDLEPDALVQALDFLDTHPEAGLLTPRIGDDSGRIQYLCRRYPTLMDLLVRGFLPSPLRQPFERRLASYEMRDSINETDVVWDPPIVSGCFMLFRTDVLARLQGFDPRYFLYFEDYDLSLRTGQCARTVYVPLARVIHHGGGASRKGFAHIRMFAASAFKFYNRFGWRLW